MTLGTILLILLVLLLLGSAPVYSYNRQWGYAPVSGIGVLLLIVVLLVVTGIIPISVDGTADNINVELPNINLVDNN